LFGRTLKRVAAIHDISCLGKCSLTVALPIISAAGVEVSVIPTAILSTPTGGFENFTYRDLTDDMLSVAEHWITTGARFDAVYSGFLGSFDQIEIVSQIIDKLREEGTLIIVDPVIGDNGRLYSVFDEKFPAEMKKLCSKADIIVPNLTEAILIVGDDYKEGPYSSEYIDDLLVRLSSLGPSRVVLTGICTDSSEIAVATYDANTGKKEYFFNEHVEGFFHGTGDVFASVLTAGLMRGLSVSQAASVAADFTVECIKRTHRSGTDYRLGINFEEGLCTLSEKISEKLL